ncbi:tetratricopeptide repeat protein [Marinobacter salinisoli]|uniref:Tetratricopeptide repeat protein n=1 Tax=Marinobacter salinisoli TaxID=2769486 RepID=A0ABX7MN72_9GAMM|nr:tetratricopeptide repeat protein [Marinobacter salinisoli]QSP93696.1 tetratricopeptide repeat protein [Marinobacter salinisoli]
MTPAAALRSALISIALLFSLAGCGGEKEMSQQEIQYLSHMDQARFYQRQGELRASTLEARSAIEMQPGKADPYFLMINNLLIAGDAINAERQAKQLLQQISDKDVSPTVNNQANLILAEAFLKQEKYDETLAALKGITSADNPTKLKAALLKARTHLLSGNLSQAEDIYNRALTMDPGSVQALIGLSKVAMFAGDKKKATAHVSRADEIDRNNAELWLWKAEIAQLDERWEAAEESYIRALEDIGQYDVMTAQKYTTITALIRVLRAQSKFSEAYVYEEILAKSPPGQVKSNLVAANKAFEAGNLREAERYLEEALKQAPDHQPSTLMLALVRFEQGRADDAQKLLAPIVQRGGSPLASKMLAASMLQQGNPKGAQSTLAALESNDTDPEILTLVAIAALENGDWEIGEALMEKALLLTPDNHDLRLRYASYLGEHGAHDRALAQIGLVRSKAPDLDKARSLEIQSHLRARDTSSAIAAADLWITEEPDSIAGLLARGNLAIALGASQEAKKYFTEAQQKDPKSVAPLISLGRLSLLQQDHTQAKREFRQAVQMSPDNPAALQGFIAAFGKEETTAFMRAIAGEHPDAIGPRLILLEIALLDSNIKEAEHLTDELLERKDEDTPAPATDLVADLYTNAVENLAGAAKHEQARTILNRALVLFPDHEGVAIQAAKAEFSRGRPDEAQAILERAREQHPFSASFYVIEADYFEQQGDYRKAAERYKTGLDKQPDETLVAGYVRNLQLSGQVDEALSYLEAELNDHPRNLKLRLTLAMLQQSVGKEGDAKANYETLLDHVPHNTVILNNLAWIYHKEGDDRAIEMAQKAYELTPDNAAVADTYGWILLKSGNPQSSVPILEKAYELEPDSEEIARHLAEAYQTAGMDAEADRILKRIDEQG